MIRYLIIIFSFVSVIFSGCTKVTKSSNNETTDKSNQTSDIAVPTFSADSAYYFIQKQVNFGPRVPNTPQHSACATYLEQQLKTFGAEVTVQKADLKAFDGTILKAKNIIGSYKPEAKTRILLFAHWDTRPWADHDANSGNREKPVLGANDGGSGVGVLLEMARHFNLQKPSIGVDIIFFDAEDYGATDDLASQETQNSWCLGSQYWAANKHQPGYRAKYGILLDMVGASNAQFYREQISDYYAQYLVDKVWQKGSELGFSNYFISQKGGAITDDHLYINQIAGIPSIDIIQYDKNTDSGFGHYWHTINDTMENIDKNTINAVGVTLMHIIYNELP